MRLTDPELAGRIRDAIRDGVVDPERVSLEIGQLWRTLDQLRSQERRRRAASTEGDGPPAA